MSGGQCKEYGIVNPISGEVRIEPPNPGGIAVESRPFF